MRIDEIPSGVDLAADCELSDAGSDLIELRFRLRDVAVALEWRVVGKNLVANIIEINHFGFVVVDFRENKLDGEPLELGFARKRLSGDQLFDTVHHSVREPNCRLDHLSHSRDRDQCKCISWHGFETSNTTGRASQRDIIHVEIVEMSTKSSYWIARKLPCMGDFTGDGDNATGNHTDPLRVGIVGGGFIGTTVGTGFRDHDAAHVVALVDIDETTLQKAGAKLGVDPSSQYTDYETMLAAEASTVEAVLIGTPHTLHYEQILAAFDRGLHVLCDKPLTTDIDQARDLVERDQRREKVLMVGYQRHLDPTFIRARQLWDAEDREPRWITADVCQNWIEPFENTWRQNPALSGGGYLYDTGSHLLDCILWTTQLTPEAVSATMEFVDDDQRVDGSASVTVRFTNGATASFSLSGETPCMREHIRMWGRQGAVVLDTQDWEPSKYIEIDDENGEYRPRIRRTTRRTKADAFIEAINTDTEPAATALDGLRVTAVTEAAYESARNDGLFVKVDPEDVALK